MQLGTTKKTVTDTHSCFSNEPHKFCFSKLCGELGQELNEFLMETILFMKTTSMTTTDPNNSFLGQIMSYIGIQEHSKQHK